MKAHIFRELVNDLRDIATQWHGSQQLRERISGRLRQNIQINNDPAQTPALDVRSLATAAGVEWHDQFDGECCANLDMLHRFADYAIAQDRASRCTQTKD